MKHTPSIALGSVLALVLLAGCASVSRRTPRELAEPQEDPVERIRVLPLIVATPAEVPPKVFKTHVTITGTVLKRRHVEAVLPDTSDRGPELDEETLKELAGEKLCALAPEGDRFVLVAFLTDFAGKLTFGTTGTADVSGYLVDRRAGKLVWHGRGVGKVGQGGLIGMMIGKTNAAADATMQALATMLQAMPVTVPHVAGEEAACSGPAVRGIADAIEDGG